MEKKNKFTFLNPEKQSNILITWILRIVVGVTFIFSGFVKGIDPWGTIYKFNDYLNVMNLPAWPNLVLTGAFTLFTSEFLAGVFLLCGCFRRMTAIFVNVFMWVMLALTLWIAIKDPVADCGCFGDALIISNWATFWKNVVLCIMAAWLLRYNRCAKCLVTPALQWLAFIVTGCYICAVGLGGYIYQPLIDFRPYKVGGPLVSYDDVYDDEYDITFIYEKDGVKKEFGVDDELPDEADGWKFIERKELKPSSQVRADDGLTLRLWDDYDDDVTDQVVDSTGRQIILFMPDMSKVSIASSWRINSLYDWARKNNIDMIAAVSGDDAQIDSWKDLSMPDYEIYKAEDTAIKEVVRGNPGVVYLEDGTIKWKSSLRALPVDDFMASGTTNDPMELARDNKHLLTNATLIYLSVMAVLIFLSFSPNIGRMFSLRHRKPKTQS